MSHVNPQFLGTYVSTTIPYVNAPPHVGFALELAQTDALVRGLRQLGHTVHASTGSDDHSLKNVRAAEALGKPVHAWIDENRVHFEELGRLLGTRFDDAVWTSRDTRHSAAVRRLFAACEAAGDLYRKRYSGAYCVGCESFLDLATLAGGLCPEHGRPPERVEEENWFFRLSRHADALLAAVTEGRLRILPEERRNEVIGFIRGGLTDFSVSRAAGRARRFGIPVPGDPEQVVYVWVDALANYLSTWSYGELGERSGWSGAHRRIHVLGKGVLRFHAVYWPALLLSAGLPLPDELRVHGHLTVDGRKIGKSLGNGVDPIELIERVGQSAVRYYLLRHTPPFKDADFSRERLVAAHDDELADELGNLARRVVTLVHRHAGGRVPESGPRAAVDLELEARAAALPQRLAYCLDRHELAEALEVIWQLVRATNRYLDVTEPWRLARQAQGISAQRLGTVLGSCIAVLRVLGVALAPFVPELATRLRECVGDHGPPAEFRELPVLFHPPVGLQLGQPPLLAQKLRSNDRANPGGR